MKATIALLILGCILTWAPVATLAFVITLDPENTMINEPDYGVVLRSFVDPPDERLGQAALHLTYEPAGSRHLFNLIRACLQTL